ncbi:MAG: hypothetical protein JSV56_09580, partial [Methanomassiliicoccales archaeon]
TKKTNLSILIVGIVVGIVIGVIISPFLSNLFNDKSETPIYQQYTEYEKENEIVYKNEKLNVTIRHNFSHGYDIYRAYWINIHGETGDSYSWHQNKTLTLGAVLNNAVELLDVQLKWFEYMLTEVV